MKIKQVMNTCFSVCSLDDTIKYIAKRMQKEQISFMIVVDENNKYKGIVEAISLLPYTFNKHREEPISEVMRVVRAVRKEDEIIKLKKFNEVVNAVPVIDNDNNVVGYVNLKCIFNNMDLGTIINKKTYFNNKNNSRYTTKYTMNDIIGESKSIRLLKEQILAAAKTKATVLIMGETGTGKELVAHAITNLSNRCHQPFVGVNCAAIPENLLQAELFGYEEGAFTGAFKEGRLGKFLQANNGTIFLDEIGDMQYSLQSKILRVLQEREIERIGGSYPIPIDVRIIAATHTNLLELVKQNKFRKDLFYRLHVIPINIPPLRERKEDIHLLVEYFIDKFSQEMGVEKPKVDRAFTKALVDYDWPGNIRELLNVLEMAVSLSKGAITEEIISRYMLINNNVLYNNENKCDLKSATDETEKNRILKTMEMYGGNKIKVAKALGISRSNLYYKIKKYQL